MQVLYLRSLYRHLVVDSKTVSYSEWSLLSYVPMIHKHTHSYVYRHWIYNIISDFKVTPRNRTSQTLRTPQSISKMPFSWKKSFNKAMSLSRAFNNMTYNAHWFFCTNTDQICLFGWTQFYLEMQCVLFGVRALMYVFFSFFFLLLLKQWEV